LCARGKRLPSQFLRAAMVCEQGVFRSARSQVPAALFLLVVVLLADPGLGDRSSEEKRNKKLAAEKASLLSGKVLVEPDQATEDFLNTMTAITTRQRQLKKDQSHIQDKLVAERTQQKEFEEGLRNLQADLQSIRAREEICANRIVKAKAKLVSVSGTYEVLVARADQAITCLRGLCKEAEQTFVYQIPMANGGKENFEKLKQETNINAVNQDLTLPPEATEGTTKAVENVQTADIEDGKPSTTESPKENVAMMDGSESTTNWANGVGDNLLNKELTKAIDANSGQTQKNFCEEGALDGKWFHGNDSTNFNGKPETVTGTNVIFADGHAEKYSCIFDPSKGTEISFNMTVGGNLMTYEGKVSNNGKLIAWNDQDYWHKEDNAD